MRTRTHRRFSVVDLGHVAAALMLLGCGGGGGLGGGELPDAQTSPDGIIDTGKPDLPPSSTQPVFDPVSDDFYALPFPSNTYLNAVGSLELWNFPNPANVGVLDYVLGIAEDELDGFSVEQVVYFPFDGGLDTSGLPATWIPADKDMAVQIVDVTDGPDYGDRLPLIWEYRADEGMYIAGDTLMVRPLLGYTLKEGHTYAAFVTSDLRGADGGSVEAAPYFQDALAGTLEGDDGLVQSLVPLKTLLDQSPDLASRVVTGTVFTVGNPSSELVRIREYLTNEAAPPELVEGSVNHALVEGVVETSFSIYEGQYTAPNFLKGTPPYDEEGGFEFDESGAPVVQFEEKMTFALSVPRNQEMPANGWPIVIYSHGTGGDYHSFIKNPGINLNHEGLAVIGINQPLHGDRVNPPLDKSVLELYSFNFLNIEAGRTVQRQSVPDNISLMRMIEAGNLVIPKD
ncbi:MAG: hypothetical protein GXP54_07645, partial [Deltaproteobacteria bacterium]|nr:hypothetical protein [Deltaproteobacteria bacterium]